MGYLCALGGRGGALTSFNYAERWILSDEGEMCYSNENICHRTWRCVLVQRDKNQVSRNKWAAAGIAINKHAWLPETAL